MIQSVISNVAGRVINRSLVSNMAEINSRLKNLIMYEFNPPESKRFYLTIEKIREMDQENGFKLRIMDLMHEPNFLENIKEYSNNKKKQRFLLNLEINLGNNR